MYYNTVFNFHFLISVICTLFFATICQEAGAEDGEDWESIPDDKTTKYLSERLLKRVEDLGYKLGYYQVLTKDSYILKVHRLMENKVSQKPKNVGSQKQPVLIMHGVKHCSPTFLANGKGLAYHLAARGYDVWVGNARGSEFSKKHRTLNSNKSLFWDFSFHEIGYYDLPAILDKIIDKTGASHVHYVGMSMGSTVFLVMASSLVTIAQDKISSVTLMAPVAVPRNFEPIKTETRRILNSAYLKFLKFIGWSSYKTNRRVSSWFEYKACKYNPTRWLCEKYYRSDSKGKDLFDFDSYVEVIPFLPCGASIKTFLHYIQLAKEEKFQQYDYGEKKNKLKYKQASPLVYDLGLINKKMYMLVGGEDKDANRKDVKWLYDHLNSPIYISKRFKDFDHRDFLFSNQPVLHETISEIIESHDQKRDPEGIQDEEKLN